MTLPESLAQEETDEVLLQAHVHGDPQAFNELLRRHRAELWVVALRVLRNHHDAEDALQTALIRAAQYADTFRGQASVKGWLRTITVNTALRELKQRGRLATPVDVELHPQDATGVAETNAVETAAVLEDALKQLPEYHRAAFFLVALRGFTIVEAAAALEVQVGTVKSRVWRARRLLVALLGSSNLTGNLYAST